MSMMKIWKRKDPTVAMLVHRLVLSFLGIWPVEKRNLFMDFRWFVAVSLEVIPMCVYFTDIYLHCHGAKKSLDSVTPGAAATLAFTRLITPRIHRIKLLEIVTSMLHDWATEQDKRVRWIMEKYAALSTRVTILTFILVGIIVGVYTSMAIMAIVGKVNRIDETIKNVTVNIDDVIHENEIQSCVFQSASSRRAFMIIQALQMFLTGLLTFSTTSFFFGLTMYICGEFDALSMKLSEFRTDDGHHVIAKMVQRHCHLIRLVECMEESFNANIMVYLFVTSALMCIDGFLLILTLKLGDSTMTVHHCSVILLMMIQLSFYTFAGDCLEMRSIELSYGIYTSNWHELPISMAKDFQFILMRASIPHQLTAGKFVAMNMMTFKDILKSTASYLSVLRVMIDE